MKFHIKFIFYVGPLENSLRGALGGPGGARGAPGEPRGTPGCPRGPPGAPDRKMFTSGNWCVFKCKVLSYGLRGPTLAP